MSFSDRLIHSLLIAHPDPTTSPDSTGQLFTTETGQPIGDATILPDDADWTTATAVQGLIQERKVRWPEGPGAGSELVTTMIFLEPTVSVRELDKIKHVETGQAYQAVWVTDAAGRGHHKEVQARRIPL